MVSHLLVVFQAFRNSWATCSPQQLHNWPSWCPLSPKLQNQCILISSGRWFHYGPSHCCVVLLSSSIILSIPHPQTVQFLLGSILLLQRNGIFQNEHTIQVLQNEELRGNFKSDLAFPSKVWSLWSVHICPLYSQYSFKGDNYITDYSLLSLF